MLRPLLVACLASLPLAARAGPPIPEDALAQVPAPLLAQWDRRAAAVDQMTRDLEARRSAWALDVARTAADAARRDLEDTRTEAANLAGRARADLQRLAMVEADARIEVDTARLEERCAEGALREAHGRAEVRAARSALAEARDRLHAARRDRAALSTDRAERRAKRQLRVAERAVADAKEALNAVGSVGSPYRRTAAPDLGLLEARRDLAAAELERDRAAVLAQLGAELELEEYEDAVDAARAAIEAVARSAAPST